MYIVLEISQQQVIEANTEPAETTICTFISIYLRTILLSLQHPCPDLLIRQTLQLQFYTRMYVASLSCLSHVTPDSANLEMPVLLQISSLCSRPIPHFKSSYSH